MRRLSWKSSRGAQARPSFASQGYQHPAPLTAAVSADWRRHALSTRRTERRAPARPFSLPHQTCLRHEARKAIPPARPSLQAKPGSVSNFAAAPESEWAALGRCSLSPWLGARRRPRCPNEVCPSVRGPVGHQGSWEPRPATSPGHPDERTLELFPGGGNGVEDAGSLQVSLCKNNNMVRAH